MTHGEQGTAEEERVKADRGVRVLVVLVQHSADVEDSHLPRSSPLHILVIIAPHFKGSVKRLFVHCVT